MNNQTLITACIILCSLGGWYVVVSKYLALKAKLKERSKKVALESHAEIVKPTNAAIKQSSIPSKSYAMPSGDFDNDQHIPGMGPPPLSNMPFQIPPEVLANLKRKINTHNETDLEIDLDKNKDQKNNLLDTKSKELHKRLICNWASIMHLSGLAIVTGIPFLNIICPTILWLLKKEQHTYLAKHGRDVINFQITLTILQFMCLGMGAIFIWIAPETAAGLFSWTRTVRVVFATGMYIPFNLFTAVPFFWGCIMIIRGTVAAYNGYSFIYPLTQPFLFSGTTPPIVTQHTQTVAERKEPQLKSDPVPPKQPAPTAGKINFG